MNALLLTCEHAGNRIPREYRRLFAGAEALLESHRGWDPGARELATHIARRLKAPLHQVMWSRLLVESNRAPTNPRIWSKVTRELPPGEKRIIMEKYWWPNRRAVEDAVRHAIAGKRRVIHIAIHSFTPELDGDVRNADVALLYDSTRPAEKALCLQWEELFRELDPALRVRRNYPYRGRSDGLTTWLRRTLAEKDYLGVELEMNQAFVGRDSFGKLKQTITESIRRLVSGPLRP